MKNKITTFVVGFLVIPIIVFICALCAFMSGFVIDQKGDNLTLSAENLAGYITSNYRVQINSIVQTVQQPVIINYLLDPTNQALAQIAPSYFFNSFNVSNNSAEATLFSGDGTILITSEADKSDDQVIDSRLIEMVLAEHREVAFLDYNKDLPLMIIGYPINDDNNEIIGIYKRVSPLTYVDYYANTANKSNENVFILTRYGNGLFFRSGVEDELSDLFLEDLENSEFQIIQDLRQILFNNLDLEDHKTGVVNFETNEVKSLGGYSIIEELDWICMVSQPKAVIYYDLNFFQLVVILFTVAVLALVSSFAIRYFNKYISPILDYNDRLKQLLSGDYTTRFSNEQVGFIGELGDNLNDLAMTLEQDNYIKNELDLQLTNLLNTDQITGLYNNRALYNVIDDNFGKNENQAIVLFNTGIYDDLNDTFGNNVSNRFLEILADTIGHFNNKDIYAARFSKDIFGIFVNKFYDPLVLNERLHELELLLLAINKVDDLQIEIKPHIAVVIREDSLLGRSDWLRLAIETLRQAEEEDVTLKIFDFTDLEELKKEKPELFDNIFSIHNEPIQGYSKSKKED